MRRTFHQAVQFWEDIQAAAFRTVNTRRESAVRHIGFDMYKNVLRCISPVVTNYTTSNVGAGQNDAWGKKKPNLFYEVRMRTGIGMNCQRIQVS